MDVRTLWREAVEACFYGQLFYGVCAAAQVLETSVQLALPINPWLLAVSFRFYVDRFGQYGRMYGAVGGVVVLLFVFYLDALVLLIGAEIDAEIDYTMTASPISAAEKEEKPDLEVESVQEANEGKSAQPVL